MSLDYLEFEKPLAEVSQKINELERISQEQGIDLTHELAKLTSKKTHLLSSIYKDLSPWQIVQMARHPKRPHTSDLVNAIFTDYDELEGDRHDSKAKAIFGGIARLAGKSVMVIGHRKGRTVEENIECNFSYANPYGFRKALRLFKLAERFALPVITFIDTKGAYPGLEAEEHNQSEAIARNLLEMSVLKTPILSVVVGEGCSGGALAIGVADKVLMLEYAYYSVISPEGCASILWRDAALAETAAQSLSLTAKSLIKLKLIDKVIKEPIGGAHQNPTEMAQILKGTLIQELNELISIELPTLMELRYQRLRSFGN